MRLPEEFEEQNNGKPVVYMFAGVCVFIVLLFAIMLLINIEPKSTITQANKDKTNVNTNQTENKDTDSTDEKSDLVSEDLDVWGM